MGQFLTKVGDQFKNSPTQRMFAAEALQKEFLPGLRLQDIPKFFDLTQQMMNKQITPAKFEKEFKGLEGKTPQAAMADGIQTLTQIVGPVQRLENVFTNFWTMVDEKINQIFAKLGKAMPFNIFRGLGKVDRNTPHKPDGSHPTHGVSGHF